MFIKKYYLGLFSFYQKHQKLFNRLIILLIFLLGLFIRLNLYPTNSVVVGDTGRDMLAGYLIAFRNMNSKYGPFNTGTGSVYPSIYYYFIACLTLIARGNNNVVSGLLILYQSTAIFLIFIIIKREFSILIALFLSLLYALSSKFIYFSMLQLTVSNSIIPVLISLVFLQSAIKYKQIIKLIISAFFLAFASSIYYGTLFFVPTYLIILLFNSNENKILKKNYLSILIFGLSFVFSFLLFYSAVISNIKINSIYQELLGSGLSQLSLTNFNIDSFFKSIELTFSDFYPKLTKIMYLLYVSIIIIGLRSKKNYKIKFILLSIFTLLVHFIFYNIHQNPLGHYLNNVIFVFAGLLAFGLHEILKKTKMVFLILVLITLISSNCFSHEKLDSDLSYLHRQQVSNIIYQYFPEFSILDGGELCKNTIEPFYWESRVYWYFQKEKPYFLFDDVNNQVSLINPNTVILCWQSSSQEELDNNYLLNKKEALLTFELQNIEYVVFANEKNN